MKDNNIRDSILKNAGDWENRSDQENYQINISWLQNHILRFDEISLQNCQWVFSHIPKTAGTSLESYLIQAFLLKDVLNINADEINNLPQCLYMKNKYPKFITGYHPMQGMLYQLLKDTNVVHISMMRDPIERVISFYNHMNTKHYHANNGSNSVLEFDDFLNQPDLSEIHNGQAKRFAGMLDTDLEISDKDIYFRAKYCIDNCFSVVGVTEFFSQFHKLIAKKCAVTFHDLPPITRLETKVQLACLQPEQMKIIKRKNKIDIQLYQYVRSKFVNLINS